MPIGRVLARAGVVLATLGLAIGLVGCAPTVAPRPIVDACPSGFFDAVTTAAMEQGLGMTFSESAAASFSPQALLGAVTATCFLEFDGTIGGNRAHGTFAFATETVDVTALAAAALALGYQPSDGANAWVKPVSSSTTEADVLTLSSASGGGALMDLAEVYPELKNVVASFRVTAG